MAYDGVPDDHEIDQIDELSVEERLTALEEQNQELKSELKQQQTSGFSDVTRRGALGVLGGSALLGAAGTVSADEDKEDEEDEEGEDDEIPDHSGDYLGEDKPVGHIDTDTLHTGDLAGVKVVGPHGYDSIQAAHDDLPNDGGQIIVTKDVAETDIVITKQTKLVGGGAGLAAKGRTANIDTSGGDGIHLKSADCLMRDVMIQGDKTGGFGLKLGVEGEYRGRYTIENVSVHNKGGHGIVIVGAHLNDKLDINARNCAGDGWHWDHDWFNENLILRLGANKCGGDGVYIDGGSFLGNTVNMLWSEDNEGWGMHVTDDTPFKGNNINGYGIEQHPKYEGALSMPSYPQAKANILHVYRVSRGARDIDPKAFGSVVVAWGLENVDEVQDPGTGSSGVTASEYSGNLKNERGFWTWHQNTDNSPRIVKATISSSGYHYHLLDINPGQSKDWVDRIELRNTTGDRQSATLTGIVPSGHYYRVRHYGDAASILKWKEQSIQ